MNENKKITIISKQLTDKAAHILTHYKVKENVFFNTQGYDIGKMMEIIQPTEVYELEIVYEKTSQPDFVEIGDYKYCENISVKFIDKRSLVNFTDGDVELVIKIFDTNHYKGNLKDKIEKIIDEAVQEKHRTEFVDMNAVNIIELSKSLKDFRANNTQQTMIPIFEVPCGMGTVGTAMKRHNMIVELIKEKHPINTCTIYSK